MRLGFAVAAHLEADVLLLDEVFAVGDEELPAQVLRRRSSSSSSAAARSSSSRTTPPRSSGSASARCSCATGDVGLRRPDARGDRALPPRCSPTSATRRERDGRPARVGQRRGRIAAARLVTADGEEREQFLAGEPLRLEVALDGLAPRAAAALHLELRDEAGLLVAEELATRPTLGWDGAGRRSRAPLRRRARRRSRRPLPSCARASLGDGRPHALPARRRAPASSSTRTARAAGSCGSTERGGAGANEAEPMSYKTCPDWPELMELAPDLQFKHITRRRRAAAVRGAREDPARIVARRGRDLLRPRPPRRSTRPTPTPTSSRRSRARTGSR